MYYNYFITTLEPSSMTATSCKNNVPDVLLQLSDLLLQLVHVSLLANFLLERFHASLKLRDLVLFRLNILLELLYLGRLSVRYLHELLVGLVLELARFEVLARKSTLALFHLVELLHLSHDVHNRFLVLHLLDVLDLLEEVDDLIHLGLFNLLSSTIYTSVFSLMF